MFDLANFCLKLFWKMLNYARPFQKPRKITFRKLFCHQYCPIKVNMLFPGGASFQKHFCLHYKYRQYFLPIHWDWLRRTFPVFITITQHYLAVLLQAVQGLFIRIIPAFAMGNGNFINLVLSIFYKNIFTDILLVIVPQQGAGQQVRFAKDLEAIANTQNFSAPVRKLNHALHNRAKPGNGAGTQVIAIGKTAGQHNTIICSKTAKGHCPYATALRIPVSDHTPMHHEYHDRNWNRGKQQHQISCWSKIFDSDKDTS